MKEDSIWRNRLDNDVDLLIMICFCQLIEKMIRFKDFLEKATYAIELSEPIPSVITYLHKLIDYEEKGLIDYIIHYVKYYDTYNKNKKEDLYNKLLFLSQKKINTYHKKGLQWVFCPWPEKVTNDFLVQLFKEAQYGNNFRKLNGTIALINEYNFWQYPLYKKFNVGRNIKNHIFGLPKIEIENSLLWQTLIHEVGHAIIEEGEMLKNILNEEEYINLEVGEIEILNNWIKEFGSDLIALRIIGPSYLITLVIYVITNITHDLWEATKEHPPIKLRIDFMFKELNEMSMDQNIKLYNYLKSAYKLFGARLEIDTPAYVEQRRNFEKDYFPVKFLEDLEKKISESLEKHFVIEKFSMESFEKGYQLANKLSEGILISSSPKNNPLDIKLENNDLDKIAKKLDEYPNKMIEIITGGTLCKWESQIDWFLKSFVYHEENVYNVGFEKYSEKLRKFDLLMSKSIETKILHSYFIDTKSKGV